jgi:hypothetical protein
MTKLEIGFVPIRNGKYFWSLDKAWGIYDQDEKTCSLTVLYGVQKLRRIKLGRGGLNRVSLDGTALSFNTEGTVLVLEKPVEIREGQKLLLA